VPSSITITEAEKILSLLREPVVKKEENRKEITVDKKSKTVPINIQGYKKLE
jgi:hypothetical protein